MNRNWRAARLPADRRIWILTAAIAAAGGLLLVGVRRLPEVSGPFPLPWWAIALSFAVAEIYPIHTQFGKNVHSRSLAEVPMVLGLFSLAPLEFVLAHTVGLGLGLAAHRRQPLLKLSYNLATTLAGSALAVLFLYRVLPGGPEQLGARSYFAVAGATVIGQWLVGAVAVPLAIAVHEGSWRPRLLQWSVWASLLVDLTGICFGLVVVTLFDSEPASLFFVILLAALALLAFRSYGIWRQRHASLVQLHQLTARRTVGDEREAAARLLADAKLLLRADVAACALFPEAEATPVLALASDGSGPRTPSAAELAVLGAVAQDSRPVLRSRRGAGRQERAHAGLRDLVAVPLRSGDGISGALLVGDRTGDVSTFEADDVTLLQTHANHAGVTLENTRLLDRLRREAAERAHEARHDSLTDLPNRTSFSQRVGEAIAQRGVGRELAVMLIDLDHFKDINDTLGHATGDAVLIEIGRRLAEVLAPEQFIARLGGDEFGIMTPVAGDAAEVLDLADRLSAALHAPCEVGGMHLAVGGSVGIAICPTHGEDPQLLLQRADIAMYAAKAAHAGVEIYDATSDDHSPRRLAMVGRLRTAIAEDGLSVFYQPKVALRSGDVVGVEALARWDDAHHGKVTPDEFIPLAEHTGLIGALTVSILRQVARQWQAWAAVGVDLEVAVNLSAHSLLDLDFPTRVADLLTEHGMPITRLRLELTESSVMTDRHRTSSVLQGLHDLGCGLSVDDYGTGYSSLSYLKQLPVDELKIDRSFVRDCATDDSDAAIVRSTIDLGRNLGLQVVAEGVEDRPTWDRLTALGCDVAQGYLLSRPLAAGDLLEWVRSLRSASPHLRSIVGRGEAQARS